MARGEVKKLPIASLSFENGKGMEFPGAGFFFFSFSSMFAGGTVRMLFIRVGLSA